MTKVDKSRPAPQSSHERDRMSIPIPRLDLSRFAIADGFIEFRSSMDAAFTFVGHRIDQILIDGDVAYTFVHSGSGVLEKVTNHLRGTVLTFSYTPNGFILEALTSDVP